MNWDLEAGESMAECDVVVHKEVDNEVNVWEVGDDDYVAILLPQDRASVNVD